MGGGTTKTKRMTLSAKGRVNVMIAGSDEEGKSQDREPRNEGMYGGW